MGMILMHGEAVWNRLYPAWIKSVKPEITEEAIAYSMAHRLHRESLCRTYVYGTGRDVVKEMKRLHKEAREALIRLQFEQELLRCPCQPGDLYPVDDELVAKYLPNRKHWHRNPENPTP